VICISAFISPLRASRENAKRIVGPSRFFEIHLATPLKVCETRDVKGLYAKARAGKIPEFTGISSPYQAPVKPALRLSTSKTTVSECIAEIQQLLVQKGFA
jgi:adenylylsulfate kinase-like enzyme